MDRVRTGIKGLDCMLSNGFMPCSANLIEGAPGTGKTTLGMQFIYSGIMERNEPGIIVTFEEFPQQYYRRRSELWLGLQASRSGGKVEDLHDQPRGDESGFGKCRGNDRDADEPRWAPAEF